MYLDRRFAIFIFSAIVSSFDKMNTFSLNSNGLKSFRAIFIKMEMKFLILFWKKDSLRSLRSDMVD